MVVGAVVGTADGGDEIVGTLVGAGDGSAVVGIAVTPLYSENITKYVGDLIRKT